MSWNKTKIVATIGPASSSAGVLKQMVQAGLDVVRLNFSHGTLAEHRQVIGYLHRISGQLKIPLAIMGDLPGPKIRIGRLNPEMVTLKKGQRFILTTEKIIGGPAAVSVNYPRLTGDVKPDNAIFLNDGQVELRVRHIRGREIECRVIKGGEISSHKGVNIPDVSIKVSALTKKDMECLKFALAQNLDYLALSFVRKHEDILQLKRRIKMAGKKMRVIAKIEKRQALDNLDKIIEVSDGIMVARGDLGVELPLAQLPLFQKMIIRKCRQAAKPVITATQMLESMVSSPGPTRAEVSDVANAIIDGTDAVMLSAETAVGRYPVEAVRTMVRIASATEKELDFDYLKTSRPVWPERKVEEAICHATVLAASELPADAIIAPTRTGATASLIASYRPAAPVIAVTPDEKVWHWLALFWGVYPVKTPLAKNTDQMLANACSAALASGMVRKGQKVVITAGTPSGHSATTDLLKICRI